MKKYISATKKEREKLMKVFKCTERMVYLALSFGSDTDLARRIRLGAKNIGCHTYVVTRRWNAYSIMTASCASCCLTAHKSS